jgi:hypothetical protein
MSEKRLKSYIWVVLATLIVTVFFFWFRDFLAGEEGRVRNFILKGKKAVEAKDLLTCSNMISMPYQDKYGNDRSTLIYAAKEFFAYYKSILVRIESIKVKLDEKKKQAEVEIVAFVLGHTQQGTKETMFEGEKGRIRVNLIKAENKWKLAEIVLYEQITMMGQTIS